MNDPFNRRAINRPRLNESFTSDSRAWPARAWLFRPPGRAYLVLLALASLSLARSGGKLLEVFETIDARGREPPQPLVRMLETLDALPRGMKVVVLVHCEPRAAALAARKIRDKARKLAAHLLEVSENDLDWEPGKFSVKGAPQKSKAIQECAFAAYTNHPQGMEAGLEATHYYDPPNLTFPFGSYICVVDIDRGTGVVGVRRFVAVNDCGNIINPMIVDGQIHGGLAQGVGPALYEEISYDEEGNIAGGSFMDYYVPTAMECPSWETDKTVTPSPHHPLGAKGVGESATVGAPPAIANAVVDALRHLGVTHIDIPITPEKVWQILKKKGVAE